MEPFHSGQVFAIHDQYRGSKILLMHIFYIPSEPKIIKSQITSMTIALASEIRVRVKVSPWHFILQY